jgi:hypothetical protein
MVKQTALKKSIPSLRAQIAELDYALVMGEVAAQKAGAPKAATAAKASPAPAKAAAAEKSNDAFAAFKKLFGM